MARNDQFPKDPKLPQPQPDALTWLNELSQRLQIFFLGAIGTWNLLIQGYQYVTTTLVGSVFAPTATTRGRVVVVNGAGAVPDRIYLCNWDGNTYQWSKFLLYESTTAAWTPGTIAAGASVSLNVAVPRATLGMMATATWVGAAGLPAGVVCLATVIATDNGLGNNTVNVVLYNLSGAPQTLGAGTLTIYLMQ